MKIQAVNSMGGEAVPFKSAADRVGEVRKKKADPEQSAQAGEGASQVPPEELLKQIKGLTQDGLYSVRFETDETSQALVVKIVDQETDEVIRQVPAEEILAMRAALDDLRGNLVDTTS